jgi:tetratricopeptide (TPR) repeat protein
MIMMMLAAQALYVGNGACAECHAEILRSYNATPMAQSSGRVDRNLPAGSFRHVESGVEYRMEASGMVHMSKGSEESQRRLDYFIGSGMAGQSFLYSHEGYLFQAPVTWYSRESRWGASPGYEGDRVSRWNRAIEPACLNCHASQIRSAAGYRNFYADPPFAQNGIGCERCHGPGSQHVAGKARMVTPAGLDSARRDAICAQCHMSGEVRVERAGRKFADYRPGDLLSDYVAYFVPEEGVSLKAAGYVEKLAGSRCKIASGDRLWCGTCHDPHRVPAPAARVAWYRDKCWNCHRPTSCARGDDCIECHMPKAHVTDVSHGVLTDHGIPRRPAPVAAGDKQAWKLMAFSSMDSGERELGLAYAEVFTTTNDLRQGKEAMRLLSAAPPDEAVQLRLAGLYAAQGYSTRAAALYRVLLDRNPNSIVALVNLGENYGAAGRIDEAIAMWRAALRLSPCLAEAGLNLRIGLKAKSDMAGLGALAKAQRQCLFPETP